MCLVDDDILLVGIDGLLSVDDDDDDDDENNNEDEIPTVAVEGTLLVK